MEFTSTDCFVLVSLIITVGILLFIFFGGNRNREENYYPFYGSDMSDSLI